MTGPIGPGARWLAWAAGLAALGCGSDAGTDDRGRGSRPTPVVVAAATPEAFQAGASSFDLYCSRCHGPRASGTDQGPPLVDRIYQPAHHADVAFYRATQFGARAHHWPFGDMPPVEGITQPEIAGIIDYVRWLQREAGIR